MPPQLDPHRQDDDPADAPYTGDAAYDDFADDPDAPQAMDLVEGEDETDTPTSECPHCEAEVYEDTEHCPSCGEWLTRQELADNPSPPWAMVIAVLAIVALLLWLL